MDKQMLINTLIQSIEQADLSSFLEYSAAYPWLTNQFTLTELFILDKKLKYCLVDHPEWRTYLVDTNLYKKKHLATFFNEISLATVDVPGEVRLMVPYGMPDCITITTETGAMQGLEFKHFTTDRGSLHEFPYKKYDIVTPNEFKLHYQNQPFVNKVYSYSEIQKRMPGSGYSRSYFDQQTMYSMKAKNVLFSDFRMKWFKKI